MLNQGNNHLTQFMDFINKLSLNLHLIIRNKSKLKMKIMVKRMKLLKREKLKTKRMELA